MLWHFIIIILLILAIPLQILGLGGELAGGELAGGELAGEVAESAELLENTIPPAQKRGKGESSHSESSHSESSHSESSHSESLHMEIPQYETLQYSKLREKPYLEGAKVEGIHRGQFKLLIAEIAFLTWLLPSHDLPDVIVYAGSAPGTHLKELFRMFPNKHWILVDPRTIEVEDQNTKITKIKEYMTPQLGKTLAEKYKNSIFISDIRTSSKDENIFGDNNLQYDIVKSLLPRAISLKFRPPFSPVRGTHSDLVYDGSDNYPYFAGKVFLQPFAPVHSTEVRIFAKTPFEIATYSIKQHEQKLAYYNSIRTAKNDKLWALNVLKNYTKKYKIPHNLDIEQSIRKRS